MASVTLCVSISPKATSSEIRVPSLWRGPLAPPLQRPPSCPRPGLRPALQDRVGAVRRGPQGPWPSPWVGFLLPFHVLLSV